MARKKSDQLLILGAASLVGASALSWYFQWPREVWGGGPQRITLTVQPTEVQQGSGTPVVASGQVTSDGQPATGSVYMRLRHPSGLYENLPMKQGPSFSESIPTADKSVGDYLVEVSDNPSFI